MIDIETLNFILVQMDVMETGCASLEHPERMNELEYMEEASSILQRLAAGESTSQAAALAFERRLDASELSAEARQARLDAVAEELEAQQRLEVQRKLIPSLPHGQMDTEAMTLLLWQADLMGTGCNLQEGMADEYASEAEEIVELTAAGMDFQVAVEQVFDERFWPECLRSTDRKKRMKSLLQAVKAVLLTQGKATRSDEKIFKTTPLSAEFFRTVFSDTFLFGDKPAKILQNSTLSPKEKKFARNIQRTSLYNQDNFDACADLCNRLNDLYHWQSNSEGPLFFSGSILYLLEVTEKDVNWFIDQVKNSRESA